MKLTIPILVALLLLFTAVSFAHAQAVSAAGEAAAAIRSSMNSKTAQAALTSTITTTSIITTAEITGVVVYGPGPSLSGTLPVTLYGYKPGQSAMDLFLTATTTTQPGGAFSFKNVVHPEGSVFLSSATYAGIPYHSSPSVGGSMAITVFETTTATSHLMADQMHLIFDFSETGTVQVMEVYILANVGVQTIIPASGSKFMTEFPLPEGALAPDFRSGVVGEADLQSNDGFWEIPAVRPGSMYGVSYAFSLPYTGKLSMNQPVALPVSAVGVLLPAAGNLKIEGPGLSDTGLSDFGGTSYHVYTGNSLPAGEQLSIKISGSPDASASKATSGIAGSRLGLIVGLGAFGLVLILAGVFISRRSRLAVTEAKAEAVVDEPTEPGETAGAETPDDAESLMDDIIALDDLYQAGELPEAAYRERRAELKEKLRAIVGDEE